jgi:hypothetical protein
VTTPDIRRERPGWDLWRDGCPDGETTSQVGVRADRVIALALDVGGEALETLELTPIHPRVAVRLGADQHLGEVRIEALDMLAKGVPKLEVELGPGHSSRPARRA